MPFVGGGQSDNDLVLIVADDGYVYKLTVIDENNPVIPVKYKNPDGSLYAPIPPLSFPEISVPTLTQVEGGVLVDFTVSGSWAGDLEFVVYDVDDYENHHYVTTLYDIPFTIPDQPYPHGVRVYPQYTSGPYTGSVGQETESSDPYPEGQ